MISGLTELRQANALLQEVKQDLKNKKVAFDEKIPVGIMIEVPSAVMIADLLAKEADFFSIGTNDLIQYALAIDRLNEKSAQLYEPAHPAVLRMIKRTIDAGHNEKIQVSICGEASSDPYMAVLLLGMGMDALSMSASSILQIKKMIRSLKLSDAQHIVEEAMSFTTGKEAEEYVNSRLAVLVPQMFNNQEKN